MAATLGSGADAGAPLLLLGASGATGQFLIQRLAGQGVMLMAVSRRQPRQSQPHVIWLQQDLDAGPAEVESSVLISLGPLVHALRQAEQAPRLGRVIALSSASTRFKAQSSDDGERALIVRLIELEADLQEVCRQRDIDLTLLKPTLIYGGEDDANVSRIGGLAARMKWLPYCGHGLRQPVHADDLARLIVDCLALGRQSAGSWLLGGGESLEYPAMLSRISSARGRSNRLLRLPLWAMKALLAAVHASGRMQDIRSVMLARQRVDLVVDDTPARERLGWQPRPFRP